MQQQARAQISCGPCKCHNLAARGFDRQLQDGDCQAIDLPTNLVSVMPDNTDAPTRCNASDERAALEPEAAKNAYTTCAQNSTEMPAACHKDQTTYMSPTVVNVCKPRAQQQVVSLWYVSSNRNCSCLALILFISRVHVASQLATFLRITSSQANFIGAGTHHSKVD